MSKYAGLSAHTAEGRRGGTFPDLLDRTSRIERRAAFSSPASAMDDLSSSTEGIALRASPSPST